MEQPARSNQLSSSLAVFKRFLNYKDSFLDDVFTHNVFIDCTVVQCDVIITALP